MKSFDPTLLDSIGIEASGKALLADIIAAAENAQIMAQEILLDPEKMGLQLKEDMSIAGAADKAIEVMYKDTLHAKHGGLFLGEESHVSGTANEAGYQWIVDPVDGTSNFSAGVVKGGSPDLVGLSCTSVALQKNGKPYIGVVRNLGNGTTYFAVKGKGAYKWDGEKITHLCANQNLPLIDISKKPAMALGHLPRPIRDDLEAELYRTVEPKGIKGSIRILGCTAYELCLTASGSLAAYAGQANPWDYAAGALIAEESGIKTFLYPHQPEKGERLDIILAAHPDIAQELDKKAQQSIALNRLRTPQQAAL